MNFKKLQLEAKEKGFNLWESGGYYYLSGYVYKHKQGIFSSLKSVFNQLKEL